MPDFVIPLPPVPSIAVVGGGAFPVRRVYCIGRNCAAHFVPIAKALTENEAAITADLSGAQGGAADAGGYYRTDAGKTAAVMRPSETLNKIIG